MFSFNGTPGPYAVGLRVLDLWDRSRVFRDCDQGRPLQTLIWYPALAQPASSMTVRDYAHLSDTARGRDWMSGMRPELDSALWAVRDAPESFGRFPLVVYAPSFSSMSWENADLCEYLASHGFAVIASASMGVATRNMTADLAGMGAQAADIAFLIGYASTLGNVDMSGGVAVAGCSWGGISNVLAAWCDSRITALIALDGSLRYWPGMVRRVGIQPALLRTPLLCLNKREWTLEEVARYLTREQLDGPNVLNDWTRADVWVCHMLGMTHRQFSSMAQRNEDLWTEAQDPEFPDRMPYGFAREDAGTSYGWMARYVLEFLNAYLKHENAGLDFLRRSPAELGVPPHFIEVSHRPGSGGPASFDVVRARGFAATAVEELEKLKPAEVLINDWAESLLDQGRVADAVELLQLNLRLYPASSPAAMNLSRAWLRSGQVELALEGYRRVADSSPFNAEARRKLRELE